jgi:hypothetical protein
MSSGGDPGGGEPHHDASPVRVVRGVALVVVGVALGVILFHTVGRPQAGSVASVAASPAAPAAATTTTTSPAPTTTAAARPPAEVKTLVANGTKTSGAGAKVSDTLRKAGYNVLAPTNTTTTAASSAVLFLPGFASEAAAVATALGLPPANVMPVPTPSPVANAQIANVVVVIGPDLAGQGAAAPSTSTTSTTAHTTTTAHATSSTVR